MKQVIYIFQTIIRRGKNRNLKNVLINYLLNSVAILQENLEVTQNF